MAQFRTTADVLDLALINAGEVTNGNSSYETQLLNYLNRVHYTLLAGGTIPLTKDISITVDEVWPWARAPHPIILDLEPKYATGTIALTNDSEAGTFSDAPAGSLKDWHIMVTGRDEIFRIASHTAGASAFQLDDHYTGETGATLNFKAFKVDYELVPDHIAITTTSNNKIQFQETAGTTITGTLTAGTYTQAQLAAHVETVLNAAGGTPAYTVTYNALTRKFTIASDRAGGAVFVLVGTGDQSKFSVHKTLGFDDEDTTNAASITSTYPFSALCRIVEPFRIHKGEEKQIYGLDPESFHRDYPVSMVSEGIPTKFSVISEEPDGTMRVRFNAYPEDNTRIEIDHVPVPRDLKDNSSSIPLVPRKHVDVLEDAATFYLMLNKNDDRVQFYANLVQAKIQSMISQYRGSLLRSGKNFGGLVARPDLVRTTRRRLIYGGND